VIFFLSCCQVWCRSFFPVVLLLFVVIVVVGILVRRLKGEERKKKPKQNMASSSTALLSAAGSVLAAPSGASVVRLDACSSSKQLSSSSSVAFCSSVVQLAPLRPAVNLKASRGAHVGGGATRASWSEVGTSSFMRVLSEAPQFMMFFQDGCGGKLMRSLSNGIGALEREKEMGFEIGFMVWG